MNNWAARCQLWCDQQQKSFSGLILFSKAVLCFNCRQPIAKPLRHMCTYVPNLNICISCDYNFEHEHPMLIINSKNKRRLRKHKFSKRETV